MSNWIEALQQVAQLRDKGILSDEEFAAEKQRILASRDAPQSDAPAQLGGDITGERRQRLLWVVGGSAAAVVLGTLLGFAVYSDISSRTVPHSRPSENAAAEATAISSLPPDTALDEFLRFASASTCEPGPQLSGAIHQLTTAPIGGGSTPNVTLSDLHVTLPRGAAHEQPKADGPGATVTEMPLKGLWHGLHVISLRATTWDDSGFSSFQLRFSETGPDALAILKQAGFPLKRVGELKVVGAGNGQGAAVGIEQLPEGSALTCARGFPSEDPTDNETTNSTE